MDELKIVVLKDGHDIDVYASVPAPPNVRVEIIDIDNSDDPEVLHRIIEVRDTMEMIG